MQLTFRYRIKGKHASRLNAQARAVNVVWNYCNELQKRAASEKRPWLGYHDFARLTAGVGREIGLHSHTVQRVCIQYDKSRKQQKKPWLRWRSRKSLGWVPFNTGHVTHRNGGFVFRGEHYVVWLHRPLPENAKIGSGSFSQDARGRWYINCPVEVEEATVASIENVGIDLGLKDFATLSTGEKIAIPQFYRKSEVALGISQRARKTRRARAIHAKVGNRRKDLLHKESAKLVKRYGLVVVGDVSSTKLSQTRMAKSVLDAGWSRFKDMLSWKSRLRGGGMLLEVSESFTSQTCSECGSLPPSRPKGIAGLRNRIWRCDDCGTEHDRDVNAARNILRVGLNSLGGGALV